MVGKQIVGKSFGGCIRYLLNRDEATILAAEGLNTENAATIIRDFNIHRKMNPDLGKAVGHLILSWSHEDKALLTPEIMAERAKEYLKLMGIENTQYVIVQRLKGKEKVRYELFDAISKAIKTATSWKAFEAVLKAQGITIQFKYKGKTKEVQGISFSKGEVKFKGSAIDSAFSYSKLNNLIESNREEQKKPSESKSLAQQIREAMEAKSETQTPVQTGEGYFPPGWFDLVQDLGNVIADDIDDEEYKRKKRYLSR